MAFIGPKAIIPAVANNMTGTTVLTSSVIDMRTMMLASVQAVWTGTPTGAFDIQTSLDYVQAGLGSLPNAGTWSSLGLSLAAPAGTASNSALDIKFTGIPYLRVVYTNSSGTGTLTLSAFSK